MYSPFFGSASLDAGAPTPSGMYPSFISVEGHPTIKIFWVFNSFSFAIMTFLLAIIVAQPSNKKIVYQKGMFHLRGVLAYAYLQLTYSVIFVVGAFISASFVVLPPIPSYTAVMAVTSGTGICILSLPFKEVMNRTLFMQIANNMLPKILKF